MATRAAMSAASDDVRKLMADPFSFGGFVPDFDRNGVKEVAIAPGTGKMTVKTRKEDSDAILSKVSQCPYTGVWRAPWVYSYFDTRIVRRSNMLLADLENQPYGRNLNFQEFMMIPPEAMTQAASTREAGGETKPAGVSVDSEREALEAKGQYYKQGEGPPLEELADAYTTFAMYTEGERGSVVKCGLVGCDGYYETARCAVEMAMTCRFDKGQLPHKGGLLTAAVCGQQWYAQRLIQSGVKFKMGEWFEEKDFYPPEK